MTSCFTPASLHYILYACYMTDDTEMASTILTFYKARHLEMPEDVYNDIIAITANRMKVDTALLFFEDMLSKSLNPSVSSYSKYTVFPIDYFVCVTVYICQLILCLSSMYSPSSMYIAYISMSLNTNIILTLH